MRPRNMADKGDVLFVLFCIFLIIAFALFLLIDNIIRWLVVIVILIAGFLVLYICFTRKKGRHHKY